MPEYFILGQAYNVTLTDLELIAILLPHPPPECCDSGVTAEEVTGLCEEVVETSPLRH